MDDYDDGDYLDMDADWIYVEDEFDLADELAENAIPEPGYMGTAAEIAMESYDFDFYGYNEDLEYGEDSYWDTPGPIPMRTAGQQQQTSQEAGKAGSKRKRTATARTSSSKRQKLAPAAERDAQPVLFRSRKAQRALPVVKQKNLKSFALLPDWKERYKHEDGVVKSKSMPAAMAKAADDDAGQASHTDGEQEDATGAGGVDADEAEWEDQDDQDEAGEDGEDDDGEDDDDNSSEQGLDIDPSQLQAIIATKLAEAGISGDEEGAFLQSINDMLSGDGKGEAAAALLEKAAQQQQPAGNDNSTSTTTTSSASRKRKAPDSAIGIEAEEGEKQTSKRGRKRKGGQAEK